MPNYASITLIGHIGQDPKTRAFEDGNTVTSFGLATNEKKRDGTEITSWWNCSCWGKGGEVIAQYLKKGDPLMVNGPVIQRPYTDANGQERLSIDVRVRDFTMLGRAQESSGGYTADANQQPTAAQAQQAQQAQQARQPPAPFDDDIPF